MRTNLFSVSLTIAASAGLFLVGCDNDDSKGTGTSAGSAGSAGDTDDSEDSASGQSSDADSNDAASDTADSDETTGDDTNDSGDNMTGIGFIVEGDGGGVSIECSVWDQDCPQGEKCMPWANDGGNAWNATKCSPLDPSAAQPGDDCTVDGSGVSGVDNCDTAAMCWDVDPETNIGNCVAFCTGSMSQPVCDDPNAACSITNDGVLILCLPACDPLLQDCADGQACYGIDQAFVCAPDASGEMGMYGEPCEFINACDPGLACVNAQGVPGCTGSSGCCSSFCDFEDPGAGASCPGSSGGQNCISWFEEGAATPGYEGVGICFIPA